MKKLYSTVFFMYCLLTFFQSPLFAQLSGDYTIGNNSDYLTIQQAVDALKTQGVGGPVNFNIKAGEYTQVDPTQSVINIDQQITGSSESNRITFQPDVSSGATVDNVIIKCLSQTSSDRGYVVTIASSYISIKNLTLLYEDGNATNEQPRSMVLVRSLGSTYNISGAELIGCKIFGKNINNHRSFAGVHFFTNNYNSIISDNSITGCINGVFSPEGGPDFNNNLAIERNTIKDTWIYQTNGGAVGFGIHAGKSNGEVIIKSNEINYVGGAKGSHGIYAYGSGNILIDGNKILNMIFNGGTYDYFRAIQVENFYTPGGSGVISNNMISNIFNNGRYGIDISGSANYIIAHNSVVFSNQGPVAGFSSPFNFGGNNSNIKILNNIFFDHTEFTPNGAMQFSNLPGPDIQVDYNNLFANGVFIRVGGTSYSSLAEWQTTGNDLNSVSKPVAFVSSSSDLHLADCSQYDETIRGIQIPEVTEDFDGELRGMNPFMGADESMGELPLAFSEPYMFSSGYMSFTFTSGDFDGDLDIDIAVTNLGSDDVALLWNDGAGNFSQPEHFYFGDNVYSIKSGFIDEDNLTDILITTETDSAFYRYNNGSGNLSDPVPVSPVKLQPTDDARIMDLAIGDVDNDGDNDFVISNYIEGFPETAVYTLEKVGPDNYVPTSPISTAVNSIVDQVLTKDLNGDGFIDLIMVDAISNNKIFISLNLGNDNNNIWLGFDTNVTELTELVYSHPTLSTIVIEDFDNDNDNDIIIRDASAVDTLVYFINDGNANFSSSKFLVNSRLTPKVITSLDYNGDGYPDLASANFGADLHLMLNRGDGTFDVLVLCERSTFGVEPRAILSSDFSGDGSPDIAVLAVNDTMNVFQNLNWIPTEVNTELTNIYPEEFQLFQNYPNPFNPTTIIRFSLPVSEYATLKIYNIVGEEILTLIDNSLQAGIYNIQFNASGLASGIYFYRLQAGLYTETKKMILMK